MAFHMGTIRTPDGVQVPYMGLFGSDGARSLAAATVAEHLRHHDLLLSSYLEADHLKAKFLGYAVDYGVVRSLLATLFTIAVGLYSVLRAMGLTLAVETICTS